MITAWLPIEKGLQRVEVGVDHLPSEAVWIDAVDITREEEAMLEARLGSLKMSSPLPMNTRSC